MSQKGETMIASDNATASVTENGTAITTDDLRLQLRQKRQQDLQDCQREVSAVLSKYHFDIGGAAILQNGSVVIRLVWNDVMPTEGP